MLRDENFDLAFAKHYPSFRDLVDLNYPIRNRRDHSFGLKYGEALVERIENNSEPKNPGIVIKMLLNINRNFTTVRGAQTVIESTGTLLKDPDVLKTFDVNQMA